MENNLLLFILYLLGVYTHYHLSKMAVNMIEPDKHENSIMFLISLFWFVIAIYYIARKIIYFGADKT